MESKNSLMSDVRHVSCLMAPVGRGVMHCLWEEDGASKPQCNAVKKCQEPRGQAMMRAVRGLAGRKGGTAIRAQPLRA